MRKVIIPAAALLAVGANLTARADYKSTVLGDSPKAYYRFSETGVTTAIDYYATNSGTFGSSGYGAYQGAIHPVPGALVSDPSNSAAKMPNVNGGNGGGNRVSIPWQADLNGSSAFSVEFWAKPTFTNQIACPAASVDFNTTPRYGWLFYQGPSSLADGNGWFFRLYHTAGNTVAAVGMALDTNQWYHVVGTYDGASTIKLYVNGAPAATSTLGGTYTPNVNRTDIPMTFGCRGNGAAGDYGWGGSMDEVAYYTNTLSDSAVLAHHEAATNPAPATAYATLVQSQQPALYFRLDEPAPTYPVAVNSGTGGAALNGEYHYWSTTTPGLQSPAYPGLETTNRVLQPSGTNGFVKLPDDLFPFPVSGTSNSPISFETWFKTATGGVILGQQTSVPPAGPSGYVPAIRVGTDGLLYAQMFWGGSGTGPADSSVQVNDDQFHHLAVTYDGTNQVVYLDGVNISSKSFDQTAYTTLYRYQLGIGYTGGWTAGNGGWYGFDGLLDEAACYDKLLTEGQVRTHFLAAVGDPAHNPPVLLTDPPLLSPTDTIYTTTPFTLTVDAYGEPPLTYQWQHAGTNLPAATAYTFTRTAAVAGDAGNYDVIVGNTYGSVTSSVVVVAINPAVPPTITNQPLARLVYTGGAVSFKVAADGTLPLRYQWKHAGTNLPGATNATLLVTNCTAAQAGAYLVGVTNVAGGVLSSTATLTLLVPAAGSYAEQVVTNGPMAYWRLNETSGTTAFDYQGSHDGTVVNNVTLGASAPVSPLYPGFETGNTCYGFDGIDSYIALPDNLFPYPVSGTGNSPFSFAAWFKTTAGGVILGQQTTVPPTVPGGYVPAVRVGTDGLLYVQMFWAGSSSGGPESTVPVNDGQFHHVAVTYNGASQVVYLDGVNVSTKSYSQTSFSTVYRYQLGTGYNGAWTGGGANNWFAFDGSIDEVAVYDKALTANTIAMMYATAAYGSTRPPFVTRDPAPASQTVIIGSTVALTGGASGSLPISYQWKKDGVNVPGATATTLSLTNVYFTDAGSYVLWATNAVGHTNTAAAILTVMPPPTFANVTNDLVLHLRFDGNYSDTSGNGNDASAPAGDPGFLAGKVGQGVHINTTPGNNYLVVNDNAANLTFDATASFTVAFWVRYTGAFNDNPIIGNAVNSTYQLGWVFTDSASAGKLEWSLVSTANSGTYLRDPVGNQVIGNGAWHNVVGVVDREQQMALAYIDGVLAGSFSIVGLGTLDYSQAITIGQDPTGNYGSEVFDMDDLGIWRRALTAYEAASIYGAGQTSGSSFDTIAPVKVFVNQAGSNVDVSWQAGTLLQSTNVTGTYTSVPGATAPFYRTSPTNSALFFRVQQ